MDRCVRLAAGRPVPGSRGPLLSRPARRPGGRVRAHQLCASRNRPGAAWVKVIADFPDLAARTDAEATYQIGAIADFVAAVHAAGARVAVHSTIAGAGPQVTAGSTRSTIVTSWMRAPSRRWRGAEMGWTPTIGALLDAPDMSRQRHRTLQDGRARLAGVLPVATRLGVPVLAGTDVTGSIPREVALLTQLGLAPKEALAAAPGPAGSSAPRPAPTSSTTTTTRGRTRTNSPTGPSSWPVGSGCAEANSTAFPALCVRRYVVVAITERPSRRRGRGLTDRNRTVDRALWARSARPQLPYCVRR